MSSLENASYLYEKYIYCNLSPIITEEKIFISLKPHFFMNFTNLCYSKINKNYLFMELLTYVLLVAVQYVYGVTGNKYVSCA